MALSQYDIKRIALEITSMHTRDLSTKVTKAINAAANEASEEWLTTSQACRILNITERQLHKLKSEGVIPYSKPRGRLYFQRSALIRYIQNKK